MDTFVIIAALASAALHAAWNAAVKASSNPNGTMTAQIILAGLLAVIPLMWLGGPPMEVWPWMGLSLICMLAATQALLKGYVYAGFAAVYPLSRASALVVVVVIGWVIAKEVPRSEVLAGIALIAFGTVLFGWQRVPSAHVNWRAIGWAVCAGCSTAVCVYCDARGSRLSSALSYGLAQAVCNAVGFAVLQRIRVGSVVGMLRRHGRVAGMAAVASTTSYLLILWVWTQSAMAVGAALRDTSLVFAALIGVFLFKERIGARGWLALTVVVLGVAVLRASL